LHHILAKEWYKIPHKIQNTLNLQKGRYFSCFATSGGQTLQFYPFEDALFTSIATDGFCS
jgi:hypothetical protein